MKPRPMIECGRWVARAARAARYGMLALWIAGPVVIAQTNSPAGPAAYRCGNSYSSAPCQGGKAVDTDDARSVAQQREAQEVKRRDAALADQMAAQRRARERERTAAAQPAVGIGPPAAASAPRRATAQPTTTTKKNNTVKRPATTPPSKPSSTGAVARPGTSGR